MPTPVAKGENLDLLYFISRVFDRTPSQRRRVALPPPPGGVLISCPTPVVLYSLQREKLWEQLIY